MIMLRNDLKIMKLDYSIKRTFAIIALALLGISAVVVFVNWVPRDEVASGRTSDPDDEMVAISMIDAFDMLRDMEDRVDLADSDFVRTSYFLLVKHDDESRESVVSQRIIDGWVVDRNSNSFQSWFEEAYLMRSCRFEETIAFVDSAAYNSIRIEPKVFKLLGDTRIYNVAWNGEGNGELINYLNGFLDSGRTQILFRGVDVRATITAVGSSIKISSMLELISGVLGVEVLADDGNVIVNSD